jgi:hypothetical protein
MGEDESGEGAAFFRKFFEVIAMLKEGVVVASWAQPQCNRL